MKELARVVQISSLAASLIFFIGAYIAYTYDYVTTDGNTVGILLIKSISKNEYLKRIHTLESLDIENKFVTFIGETDKLEEFLLDIPETTKIVVVGILLKPTSKILTEILTSSG